MPGGFCHALTKYGSDFFRCPIVFSQVRGKLVAEQVGAEGHFGFVGAHCTLENARRQTIEVFAEVVLLDLHRFDLVCRYITDKPSR